MHKTVCGQQKGLCKEMVPVDGSELLQYLRKVDFVGNHLLFLRVTFDLGGIWWWMARLPQGWAAIVSSSTTTETALPDTIWSTSSKSHPVDIDGSASGSTTRASWSWTWTVSFFLNNMNINTIASGKMWGAPSSIQLAAVSRRLPVADIGRAGDGTKRIVPATLNDGVHWASAGHLSSGERAIIVVYNRNWTVAWFLFRRYIYIFHKYQTNKKISFFFADRVAIPGGSDVVVVVVVAARVDLQPAVQRFAGQEVRGRWRLLLDVRRMHPLSGIYALYVSAAAAHANRRSRLNSHQNIILIYSSLYRAMAITIETDTPMFLFITEERETCGINGPRWSFYGLGAKEIKCRASSGTGRRRPARIDGNVTTASRHLLAKCFTFCFV